jgi:RNA 3'-terminal phosphate cyclase
MPMALGGGGVFRTGPLSRHATTNIAVIEQFLPGRIRAMIKSNRACRAEISANTLRR